MHDTRTTPQTYRGDLRHAGRVEFAADPSREGFQSFNDGVVYWRGVRPFVAFVPSQSQWDKIRRRSPGKINIRERQITQRYYGMSPAQQARLARDLGQPPLPRGRGVFGRAVRAVFGRRARRNEYTVDTAGAIDYFQHDRNQPGTWVVEFWDGTTVYVVPSYTEPVDRDDAIEQAVGVWEERVVPNMDTHGAPPGWEPSAKDVQSATQIGGGRGAHGRQAPRQRRYLPKHIRFDANRWRDSNGNTYHRVYISSNGRPLGHSDITYGYGSHYEQTAMAWLAQHGYIPLKDARSGAWRFFNSKGVKFESNANDVRRKRDL